MVRGWLVRRRLKHALLAVCEICEKLDLGLNNDAEEDVLNIKEMPHVREPFAE